MVHWSGVALCARMTTSSVEAITGGSSSFTPAQHPLNEPPDRTSPVRDALFGRKRRFREGHAELGREEQRVVAEPAVAAGRREYMALAGRLDELRLGGRRLDVRHDAAVACRPLLLGQAGESFEQQRIVERVDPPFPRLPPRFPVHQRPARREDSRGAVEGVHLEPGVLGERREVAAGREVTRLGDGVLGEARPALQIQLFGEPLEELVRRKHELERESREDVADLAHLAVVAGPDQELHQPAPRRNRATSPVVEYPVTSATRTTRPPQPSTTSAPPISLRALAATL